MAIDWIRITLRLVPDMHRKISVIAQNDKRSLNAEIEFCIQEIIKKYEEENGPIPPEK